jgi:hypothetical protein
MFRLKPTGPDVAAIDGIEDMTAPAFRNPLVQWIDHRLPVFSLMQHELHEYPTPKNLNYWWSYGSLAGATLVIMIISGGLRQRRARHARRQLGLVDPLHPHDRGDDVLRRRLHPHLSRPRHRASFSGFSAW